LKPPRERGGWIAGFSLKLRRGRPAVPPHVTKAGADSSLEIRELPTLH
jgi:hypothetical protein